MMFQTLTLLKTSLSLFQGGTILTSNYKLEKSLIESHAKFQKFLLLRHENKSRKIRLAFHFIMALKFGLFISCI